MCQQTIAPFVIFSAAQMGNYNMSLDVELYYEKDLQEDNIVYEANITHNLNRMATQAGLYYPLWRATDVLAVKQAGELIPLLRAGIKALESNREYFEEFNPENGWGDYEILLSFARAYLVACERHPYSLVYISR